MVSSLKPLSKPLFLLSLIISHPFDTQTFKRSGGLVFKPSKWTLRVKYGTDISFLVAFIILDICIWNPLHLVWLPWVFTSYFLSSAYLLESGYYSKLIKTWRSVFFMNKFFPNALFPNTFSWIHFSQKNQLSLPLII